MPHFSPNSVGQRARYTVGSTWRSVENLSTGLHRRTAPCCTMYCAMLVLGAGWLTQANGQAQESWNRVPLCRCPTRRLPLGPNPRSQNVISLSQSSASPNSERDSGSSLRAAVLSCSVTIAAAAAAEINHHPPPKNVMFPRLANSASARSSRGCAHLLLEQ